ncbi:MAG: hypothetical protein BMS9Abin05_2115 [Rhodothermia bacterium]|nr:MAG: hypothetical protein BMS9Abin05_2115 [Rhodothermia bacterium]
MRTKIIAALLAVLTALGGLNLFKSIKDRLTQPATAQTSEVVEFADVSGERTSKIRVRVKAKNSVQRAKRDRVRASGAFEVMIEERFKVRAGQTLAIYVNRADVEIETGSVDEANIRVTLESNHMEKAIERFERMNFQVAQVGDEVRIESESPRNNWNWNGKFAINIFVTIPQEFNAELRTTHGDVELDDINGFVLLNTTHGDISAQSISGPQISLVSTHGDIEASSLQSNEIVLKTTHADIEIGEVDSKHFTAETSHGDVTIERLTGDSDITTSHGNIDIALLNNFSSEVKTSHGDVTVYTPSNIAAELDLEGSQVRVSSGYDLSGSVKKDRVKGLINGGGSKIRARTTHGSIELKNR